MASYSRHFEAGISVPEGGILVAREPLFVPVYHLSRGGINIAGVSRDGRVGLTHATPETSIKDLCYGLYNKINVSAKDLAVGIFGGLDAGLDMLEAHREFKKINVARLRRLMFPSDLEIISYSVSPETRKVCIEEIFASEL